ncbi:MAG: glycosyl transferase [Clostridia bacterium]|nr:glycosyl transferase [Clostridia bacterium]
MSDKIPLTIHYCWFGNKEKPAIVKKCIKSWQEKASNFEIREWNENNFDINMNQYVKEAYKMNQYAFLTDYARLWIIYNYGGIYLDTDVELLKNLDDLLKYEAFFASEDNFHISTGLGFGAKKNNLLIKTLMNDYSNISFIQKDGKIDRTTCPIRNTKTIKQYFNQDIKLEEKVVLDNICFFSKEYFCPLDYETKEQNITSNTYAIHWYGQSWLTNFEKFKKIVKRFLKRMKIIE